MWGNFGIGEEIKRCIEQHTQLLEALGLMENKEQNEILHTPIHMK